MIGNQTDASLAATRPGEFLLSDDGCSREVYLINGVVYKVQRGEYSDNRLEYSNASKYRPMLPEGYAIPKIELYGDVLAMEYIEGNPMGDCIDVLLGMTCSTPSSCIPEDISERLNTMGWFDQSYGNAIKRDGIVYLIDVA